MWGLRGGCGVLNSAQGPTILSPYPGRGCRAGSNNPSFWPFGPPLLVDVWGWVGPWSGDFRKAARVEGLISPILLYGACIVGAVGVAMALPRRGVSPQVIGALIGAGALGLLFFGLAARAGRGTLPNINFYLFSAIALGSALRVISHPRPVYAALYFILTILASCGLYVLLSAEFMAFALVIVYAGAILITYLFVIMLATESPTADQVEALSAYDRYSREPVAAAIIGFLLVAAVSTMMARGVGGLPRVTQYADANRLQQLPRRIETALLGVGLIDTDEHIARAGEIENQRLLIDLFPKNGGPGSVTVGYGDGRTRVISTDNPLWPKDLELSNVEGVGFTLLADHPGSIEVAGVVLLMAMLGAVVLARKKVELDDVVKFAAQTRSLAAEFTPEASPLMAPEVPGGPTLREAETVQIKPPAAAGRGGAETGNGRTGPVGNVPGGNGSAGAGEHGRAVGGRA